MEGFWISPELKITQVQDHLMSVGEAPDKFGISWNEFGDMLRKGYSREAILIEALKNGWVRVRGHHDYITFEGWGRNDDIIASALVFARQIKLWDNNFILINNLKSDRAIEITVGELKEKYGAHKNPRIRFTKKIKCG